MKNLNLDKEDAKKSVKKNNKVTEVAPDYSPKDSTLKSLLTDAMNIQTKQTVYKHLSPPSSSSFV